MPPAWLRIAGGNPYLIIPGRKTGSHFFGKCSQMTRDPRPFEHMMLGAEYLASLTADRIERTEHLLMAGKYHLRAREAGSCASPETHH